MPLLRMSMQTYIAVDSELRTYIAMAYLLNNNCIIIAYLLVVKMFEFLSKRSQFSVDLLKKLAQFLPEVYIAIAE